MLELIIIGLVQGIAEWLPISSDGMLILVLTEVFGRNDSITQLLEYALFLHLGTTLAAIIYFRKEIKELTQNLLKYKALDSQNKAFLNFVVISTAVSGVLGLVVYKTLADFEETIVASSRILMILVALFLFITGLVQIKRNSGGTVKQLSIFDAILTGILQGLAVLPGLSRSGLTVSGLLFRNIDEEYALKASFIISIPIVILGNIYLLLEEKIVLGWDKLFVLLIAFISGLLTIQLLFKVAKKINFGPFVIIFAILVLLSAFV